MIAVCSLRQELRWPRPVSCIQDAFFSLLRGWLAARRIAPTFWNVSWSEAKAKRDDQVLRDARWIFIFSSNEFVYHLPDVMNPLAVASSNARLARILPHLNGKHVVVFSTDAMDTPGLLRKVTLGGAALASFTFISEADFPLTAQTLRYGLLRAWAEAAPFGGRSLDFAYWGTTKRRMPGGAPSGDHRYDMLRALLRGGDIRAALIGNHFGAVKAEARFNTDLTAIAPRLAQARATCCWQWPGHGHRLTARYIEALALGMVPFVHADYDSERSAARAAWQRISSAEELRERVLALREPGRYRDCYEEAHSYYLAAAPSDEDQGARFAELLAPLDLPKGTPMETKEWQRGFALDRLKAFAAPFRERHKPLVFGAFGLTKERDVAEALADKRAIWTGGDAPTAIALFSIPKVMAHQQDFAQREFSVPPGHCSVKAFAALSVEAGTKVLRALCERAGAPVWVEIFEEDVIARAALIHAGGFKYVTSKVMAGSEIKGVYTNGAVPLPPLPAEELATLLVLDRAFLSAAELAAIKTELGPASPWEQHYSSYNKRKSWEAFALRGYDDDPHFIVKPAEMSKQWKEENKMLLLDLPRPTKAAQFFPATLAAVARIVPLGECDRVRFMRLRAKDGELSRHADITDRDAGTADGRISRLHIPIITSEAVRFFGWSSRGERLEMSLPDGALTYLDQRKPHAVLNTDPMLNRVHLVVDCKSSAAMRARIAAALAPELGAVA